MDIPWSISVIASENGWWQSESKGAKCNDLRQLSRRNLTKNMFDIWVFPKIWENLQIIHLFIGFSIINHPFWGTPIFENTHISKIHKMCC